MDNTKRLQLPLTEEQLTEIDGLVKKGGFRTRTALFDSALCMLEWAMSHVEQGRLIAAVDEEGGTMHTYSMPAFQKIQRQLRVGHEEVA